MITNLEEAIQHCLNIAEREQQKGFFANAEANRSTEYGKICYKCAAEYRQLAELLKELKKYRIAHYKLRDMDYEYDFNSMFGENPMYYGEKVWDLFGDIDASVEYEVMGYEEVNADDN